MKPKKEFLPNLHQALIATAHKLARVVYKMLKDKVPYAHTTAQAEDDRFREREIAYLRRRAAKLGLTLAEPEALRVSLQAVVGQQAPSI